MLRQLRGETPASTVRLLVSDRRHDGADRASEECNGEAHPMTLLQTIFVADRLFSCRRKIFARQRQL